jgi:glycine dehydrogenase
VRSRRKNRVFRSYIGLGYHDTITPAAIARNVFENPGWYTPYTPYQAEIAQGRLESLLNFQTMVSELTGMEVANASLLDEATAAAEAMALLLRVQRRADAPVFIVSDRVFPHVRDVLQSRAEPLGIRLRFEDVSRVEFEPEVFGIYLQTPDDRGEVADLSAIAARAHAANALVAVGTDLLALTIMTPPGEAGADVVVGNAQRFGVPLGYGGPHAAFFATRQTFLRQAPGRVIGVSVDAQGRRAYRMALQTREQHIRREKATSNICTAQALLANMAAFYAVYHGPKGLRDIGARVHDQATRLAAALTTLGLKQANEAYFDTVRVTADKTMIGGIRAAAERREINFRYSGDAVQVSLNETVSEKDLADVVAAFADAAGEAGALLVRAGQRQDGPAARTAAHVPVPDASGVQRASL